MAPAPEHTYAAKCRLAPVPRTDKEDGMPPMDSQFFYSSIIPIDDPLSTGSVTAGSDAGTTKGGLRPFARGDNNTLEKAWLSFISDDDRRNHRDARTRRNEASVAGNETIPKAGTYKRDLLVQAFARDHYDRHRTGFKPQDLSMPASETLPTTPGTVCCSALFVEVTEELHKSFCGSVRKADPTMSPDCVVQDVTAAISRLRHLTAKSSESQPPAAEAASSAEPGSDPASNAIPPGRQRKTQAPTGGSGSNETTPTRAPAKATNDHILDLKGRPRSTSSATIRSSKSATPAGSPIPVRHPIADDGISGKPFVRVGSLENHSPAAQVPVSRRVVPVPDVLRDQDQDHVEALQDTEAEAPKHAETIKDDRYNRDSIEVAVGVSRLHMVSLPMLEMKPIYWSPVNDVAVVTRATWFYRDTMLPVSPPAANQLEAGYHDLRPWTETWGDEIRCAIDVGPLGEEKVSHQLWPKESDLSHHDKTGPLEPFISSDPFCAARCFRGEAAAEGSVDQPLQVAKKVTAEPPNRPFANYHVIYKNDKEAFMLKPSLKPSAYYGRRPLLKITRGITVGVPVVRGFDRSLWERIHHRNQTPSKPGTSAARQSHESSGQGVCPACKAEKDKGQVTDLVLVAHGIGQKFAERVESFHFTHAINGFRRAVNIELGSPIVQQVLREDQNGLMILPLNWRTGLSFEDGGPLRDEDKDEYTPEGFGLKDIEPETIPAIRSMISDVMFDIPFYMSHHKGKMIKALVSEANRVYRLWCRNNPGFAENGRVHLIGHSLGSAMAIEVLSRQPTIVPRIDLSRTEPETGFFEFDTKNIFLVGSPAGFFLLLERGTLMPRRGRRKPGADPGDTVAHNVVGDTGTFGCLAVDNIYNVLAKEDPIAYLLNGAVDSVYSSSLEMAYAPSTSTSILKSVGDAMRNVVPGMAPAPNPLAPEVERPPAVRLPSQLELEVHDFTREEIAEKKAFLLNDNGQIDWYLKSGGGPLEIQYLNMLSAHSSYWTNHDFIRMLCIEIGRKPGRSNTIPAMRAVKATKRMMPTSRLLS